MTPDYPDPRPAHAGAHHRGPHHDRPPDPPRHPPADPRDLKIVSDNRADTFTLAQLTGGRTDLTRRAAAGLMVDLRPHVVGELSAVDRAGRTVPMQAEIEALTAIRRHVRA